MTIYIKKTVFLFDNDCNAFVEWLSQATEEKPNIKTGPHSLIIDFYVTMWSSDIGKSNK